MRRVGKILPSLCLLSVQVCKGEVDKDKAFQIGAGHSEKRVLTSKTKHLRVVGNVYTDVFHTQRQVPMPLRGTDVGRKT